MEIIAAKDRLKNFYYSDQCSNIIKNIRSIGQLPNEQVNLINHYLALLLFCELEPNNFIDKIKTECQLDEQKYTITLTIIQQKLLDPLKEVLDTVYNSVGGIKTGPVPPVLASTERPIEIQQTIIPAIQPIETTSDPLDMFDKAKRDIGPNIETQNIQASSLATNEIKENIPAVETNQNINSLRVNKAAILEDSSATNLKFQDNQSVERLSSILKAKAETLNQEDLNLYVPTPEEKVDDLKPLNPIETGNDIDGLKESAQEETIPPVPIPATLINSNTTEPKNSTIAENIAQSRLKFAQNEQRGIVAEKSYSKLLWAMNQKPKNQPAIVGKLKETFEHPERYTVPQEPSRPKPKKYSFTDGSNNISVTSSQEKSSNTPANAIMQEEVENDIINLAKNISRTTSESIPTETPRGPIVYTKQGRKTDDPFANITPDKTGSSANKNPNVIDLS